MIKAVCNGRFPYQLDVLANSSNYRARLALSQLENLDETHAQTLIVDKSAAVRQPMAKRADLSDESIATLIQDKHDKVHTGLLANGFLPEDVPARP